MKQQLIAYIIGVVIGVIIGFILALYKQLKDRI